ncbi:MAG: glycoside hydrolase family 78 protein [Clostridium sp.]|nr:glycoside hydrolase family 78 protein [Clostridium sp.]
MLKISELLIDGRENPFGISSATPLFSWKLESDKNNTFQSSYHIQVTDENNILFWDSGIIKSERSAYIQYDGKRLDANKMYFVNLSVTDTNNEQAMAQSEFYSGKLDDLWTAKWIGSSRKNNRKNNLPPELFEKVFEVKEKPKRAVLYASAMGIYKGELNEKKIGNIFFAPGYTHYKTYFQYQSYDVTDIIKTGNNVLSFYVANGWYLGTIGNKNNVYGNSRGLIAELHLFYENGKESIISTNEEWQSTIDTSLCYADFYNGQIIDNTKSARDKWQWEKCTRLNDVNQRLVSHFGAYVTEDCRLKYISKNKISDSTVYDFGQNHAGVLHLTVSADKGTVIKIRHSEIINEDGTLFTKNLRKAKQELTLICGTDGVQEFMPEFTFMGFRYAEIKADKPIEIIDLESVVLTSDAKITGSFACSDKLLTRLQQNIEWGQRSNFIDIPTDCPQRDERMGWTGDIAVFAEEAAQNRNISAFMKKWLYDLQLDQRSNGTLPVTVPEIKVYQPTPLKVPIAIWGDAATMVPWAVYNAYGDKNLLENQYNSMKKYTDSEVRAAAAVGFGESKYLWNVNAFQYGDWCAANESVFQWELKGRYLATAYFANSVSIMQKAAKALGKTDDKKYYSDLHSKICNAFAHLCIKEDGTLKGDFQSNYICALYFNLVPENKKDLLIKRLVELVRENNHRVMTGFAGTPYTSFVLADNGYVDDAYKLLLNTECPGWLYTVKAGGTTIWERWDALDENGHIRKMGRQSITDMVSFNHYAYGAVGSFFYRRILGIEPNEAGYKKFTIKPVISKLLDYAEGYIDTIYGKISVKWNNSGDNFKMQVTVPVNTSCTLIMPNGKEHQLESGTYKLECEI